jgi:hypothetical protein
MLAIIQSTTFLLRNCIIDKEKLRRWADIVHRPVFYLKHYVSETGFFLRLQMKPTQSGPIDRASLSPDPYNYIYYNNIYINGCVCVCVFGHNSGTPGAI